MTGPTVAVLHGLVPSSRPTTVDHVLCYVRHLGKARILHHHIRQQPRRLIEQGPIDLVVMNYCFLSLARRSEHRWRETASRYEILRELGCPIVALPQDDYKAHELLDRWFTELEVDVVLSPIESNLDVLYPWSLSRMRFGRQLTGYVEESRLARIAGRVVPLAQRPIDIGTRVSLTPPQLGRYARKKAVQALALGDALAARGFNVDISTDRADAIASEGWFDFLASCRFTVGRKGGASIHDPDGSIGVRIHAYMETHPDATLDEIEQACFSGLDGRHVFTAVSPRLFDAAATRTCQILAPDDYLGVLEPWVHYIPLEEDSSNLDDVVAAMRDIGRAQQIADACYDELIGSGRFTYAAFARDVVDRGLGDRAGRLAAGVASRVTDPSTERLLQLPTRFGMDMLQLLQDIRAQLTRRDLLADLHAATILAGRYAEHGIDLPPGRLGVEVPSLGGLTRLGPLALEFATIAAAAGATDAVLPWIDEALAEGADEQSALPWVDPWAFEQVLSNGTTAWR